MTGLPKPTSPNKAAAVNAPTALWLQTRGVWGRITDAATFDNTVTRTSILVSLALLAGCGFTPQKLPYADPQVQQLLLASKAASTNRFGFTPVSTNSDIRLEKSSGAYDRMLHVYGRTRRTIAFRKQGDGFTWIGEQEIYRGPKQYTTVDGTDFEELCFTYEVQRVAHYKLNHLNISYSGEDARLAHKENLTLQTILPILREWGYNVEQIGASNRSQPIRSQTNRSSSAAGYSR